jgi:hypothetical protein
MGVFPVSLSETAVASAAFLECPIPLWNDLARMSSEIADLKAEIMLLRVIIENAARTIA